MGYQMCLEFYGSITFSASLDIVFKGYGFTRKLDTVREYSLFKVFMRKCFFYGPKDHVKFLLAFSFLAQYCYCLLEMLALLGHRETMKLLLRVIENKVLEKPQKFNLPT